MGVTLMSELPADYFTKSRADLTQHLSGTGHRVLDLGCGVGNLGARLKRLGLAAHVVGIDNDHDVASIARRQLDDFRVVDLSHADIPHDLGPFTAVFLADIIEHVLDPWSLMRGLHEYLDPRAQILASIPNLAALTVLGPLALADQFSYRHSGILDRTHLHFFTRRSALRFFADTGYEPRVVGANSIASRRGPCLQAVARCLGRFGAEQWIFKAYPTASGS